MAAKKNHRAQVRSFEREHRVQALLDAGIIKSADEIPEDAIPASPEYIARCQASMSLCSRPPYFRAMEYICTDCQQTFIWTGEEQRFWYEQLQGFIHTTAARCQSCRKRRRGLK